MSTTPVLLSLPKDALLRLCLLRTATKFGPTRPFYTGIKDEAERQRCEAAINALIGKIEAGIGDHPTKQFVLGEFSVTLKALDPPVDTEDRERFCTYLEEIMDIVGLESSDGVLNTWLYGFDLS